MGVRDVGPYRPRFLAATDFLGCFTQGNGEKICCLGVMLADVDIGVDGKDDLAGEETELREGVEEEDVL